MATNLKSEPTKRLAPNVVKFTIFYRSITVKNLHKINWHLTNTETLIRSEQPVSKCRTVSWAVSNIIAIIVVRRSQVEWNGSTVPFRFKSSKDEQEGGGDLITSWIKWNFFFFLVYDFIQSFQLKQFSFFNSLGTRYGTMGIVYV